MYLDELQSSRESQDDPNITERRAKKEMAAVISRNWLEVKCRIGSCGWS